MKKVTAVLLGAGDRGMSAYGSYALANPDELQFVAVAEPREDRRKQFQSLHGIKDEMAFAGWGELLNKPKMADAILICTWDTMHYQPTLKAIEKGYHILLEKPISPDPVECLHIGDLAKQYDKVFMLGYVMRYMWFMQTLKRFLDEGRIGRLMSVHYAENVGIMHFAHSFVRGNWRNSKESCPMILSKCCHDMDAFLWLVGADCVKVASFGELSHFTAKNAPKGAADRCLDGCPAKYECMFYAPDVYLRENSGFSSSVISVDTSPAGRLAALKDGPYGRCVYRCDNDVVDHQILCLEYANGVTINMSMCAFTDEFNRTMKFMGTKGQMRANLHKAEIEVADFATGARDVIRLDAEQDKHGGGDFNIMRDFVRSINGLGGHASSQVTADTINSHLIALAAEKARVENTVVEIGKFAAEIRKRMQ